MSLFYFLRPAPAHTLSQQLDKIGYFDLVTDPVKKEKIMEVIDKNAAPGQFGNGNHWLYIPNEDYLKSVFGLPKEQGDSRTSDFRSFELSPRDMVGDSLDWYLKSLRLIFEKNGLTFHWADEKVDWERPEPAVENISHQIRFNDKLYTIYTGNVRSKGSQPALDYLRNFRKALNDVVQTQNPDMKFILLTAPESVYFVLTGKKLLEGLKKIVTSTDNEIEE